MMRIPCLISVTAWLALTTVDSTAQTVLSPPVYSYADLADRVLVAPVAVTATVTEAIRLKPEQSPRLASGHARVFVRATAKTLIRGPGDVPPAIRYLADVPLDAKGRLQKLKGREVLVLGRPVPGHPGDLQLVSPDAQFALTPDLEKRVRAILTEAVAVGAPPPITGISSAFHVPGSVPGESETQIFVATQGDRPISLSVLRRPGQERQWSVALGELVDEAAGAPAHDSLLWYRLACGLPQTLPTAATRDLDTEAAAAATADFRFVLDQLGPCARSQSIRRS